jgi:hypothetical protein
VTPRASQIIAIAFALLLVVLGHDALMAANPHAMASPRPEVATTGHGSHHGAHRDDVTDPGHASGGEQGEHSPCGTLHGVRPQPAPDLLPDIVADAALMLPVRPPARMASAPTWDVPAYPPDVRRALLQVFLN